MGRSDGKATELWPCPKGKGFYDGLNTIWNGGIRILRNKTQEVRIWKAQSLEYRLWIRLGTVSILASAWPARWQNYSTSPRSYRSKTNYLSFKRFGWISPGQKYYTGGLIVNILMNRNTGCSSVNYRSEVIQLQVSSHSTEAIKGLFKVELD